MIDKEKITQCPCPNTTKLSKEEKMNTIIEAQCLQHEALLKQFDYHFKKK